MQIFLLGYAATNDELYNELAQGGATVFVSTHFTDEAEYCGRLGIMSAGRTKELTAQIGYARCNSLTPDVVQSG